LFGGGFVGHLANNGPGSGGADFGSQETRTSGGLSSTGAHATAEINFTGDRCQLPPAGTGSVPLAPVARRGDRAKFLVLHLGLLGRLRLLLLAGRTTGGFGPGGAGRAGDFGGGRGGILGAGAGGRGRGGGGWGCIYIAHNKFNLIVTVVSMQPAVSSARDMPDNRNGQNTPAGVVFRGKGRFFEAGKGPKRVFVQ
jgi:hypothetical protein